MSMNQTDTHDTPADAGSPFRRAVEHNLRGVRFFSVGACPGCDDCGLAQIDCPMCDGAGQLFDTVCSECDGEGKVDPDQSAVDAANEGSFSWSSCDSCGSGLGGNRYPAHGIIAGTIEEAQANDRAIHHWEVCADCLFFHAYGDEPEGWE